MIRVLIADDSPTFRALARELLSDETDMVVIGEAATGVEAVRLAKALKPSVIAMDIGMPGIDGFEATRRVMEEAPTPVVIVSNRDVRDVSVAMRALEVGALTVLPKPAGPASPSFERERLEFAEALRIMADVSVVKRFARPMSPVRAGASLEGVRPSVVAIASSTGGPAVLKGILSGLPVTYPAPVLVVQHIAPTFVAGMVDWLDGATVVRVKVAEDGERLEAGTVYFAPGDHHLHVSNPGHVRLDAGPPVGGFRPSGTALFQSVAKVYGRSALGIVLSGMGRDGVDGLAELRSAGGRAIAQDEASSAIFGMPGAAVTEGVAELALPPAEITKLLCELGSSGEGGQD